MRHLTLGLALLGALTGTEPDLDCARPVAGQEMVGRLRLSENGWQEDVNRAAMWDAFGRCAALPNAATCRDREKERFEAAWDTQKAAIEAKYEQMLRDSQARCQAAIT
jgi:hypothetical protein